MHLKKVSVLAGFCSNDFGFDVSVVYFTAESGKFHPSQGRCDIVCIKDRDILQLNTKINRLGLRRK